VFKRVLLMDWFISSWMSVMGRLLNKRG